MPWVNRRANGSRRSLGAMPRSASALVKNRAYIRWRMACSTPPMYWSTGQPAGDRVGVEGRVLVPRVGEAQEVPRRVDERVHRVGLADGRAAAHGARRVQEALVEAQRRLAGRPELDVVGREHRQLVVGHRHGAVVGAVDDRDRAAPEALPGQQPVAQAVVDLALADALLLEPVDRLGDGVGLVEAVEPLAVDGRAVADVRLAFPAVGRLHRADDGEVVGHGEVPVALVLAGHGHDRPGAVAHQHVVGEVHRHRLVVERVEGVRAGEHAALLERALAREAVELALGADLGDEVVDRLLVVRRS